MFNCEQCKVFLDGSPKRVVVAIRRRAYRNRTGDSLGHEIVKELDLCGSCATGIGDPVVVNPEGPVTPPAPPEPAVPDQDPTEGLRRFQRRYERA